MADTIHQLWNYGLVKISVEVKCHDRSSDLLWKEYFRDPSQWWDNRSTKLSPASPDFKHKVTKESLWINGWHNPCWVGEELSRRGLQVSPHALNGHHPAPLCNADVFRFVVLLRSCAKNKDLHCGSRVHHDILNRGLLKECSDALVTMYAQCGALAKAQELLDMHKSASVISWTALIAGYARHGQGQNALNCFEHMQRHGLSPDAVTFACILKACGSIKAADKGEQIHDEITRQGLLESNIVLGNALVDMYAKCGALTKARRVLEELPFRDVVSWNALIGGYARQGQGEQALDCFKQMQVEGLHPDAKTFACILKACGSLKAADKGEQIHNEIAAQGLLGNDIVLANALVDMYAKCGALAKAQCVLEDLPSRDTVTWNSLITGYVQQGQGGQALNCFERMKCDGLSPDMVTFTCILKACGSMKAAEKGEHIHYEIVKQGLLENNIVLGNALVDMYAKCGVLVKAQRVLEEIPFRDVITWNALIAGYAQQGEGEQVLNCFEWMKREGLLPDSVTFACILKACSSIGAVDKGAQIHDEIARRGLLGNNIVLGTALIDMYAKCGALGKAQQVFEKLPFRDVVSWNALITGYAQQGHGEQAVDCFERMQQEGLSPDAVTFACILKAYGSIGGTDKGKQIHGEIGRQGLLGNDIVLGTALVDMYAKCGALPKAQHVLDELPSRNVVSWSALMTGYAQQGQGEQALKCLERMQCEGLSSDAVTFACILKACGSIGATDKGEQIHGEIARNGLLENNIFLGNALVDMYAKCGTLTKAARVLEELPSRNVASWNALITGYAQQGQGEQALRCLEQMQNEGLSPDGVTFACILKACGTIGAMDKGEQIHDKISGQEMLGKDIVLGTTLVGMYAKCGALSKALQVLKELPVRDVVSWSALIAGYIQQGQGEQALNCLERMQREGISPNVVTFSCMLNACSHLGLVEDAYMYFVNMSSKYGIKPDIEHYTCMVDLFGRAGHLDKAVRVIQEMPSSHYPAVWSALLSACQKWSDVNVGRWAFEQALQIDKHDAAAYVLMANIYAAAGMQEDAEKVNAMRMENEAWRKLQSV